MIWSSDHSIRHFDRYNMSKVLYNLDDRPRVFVHIKNVNSYNIIYSELQKIIIIKFDQIIMYDFNKFLLIFIFIFLIE